MSGRSVEPELIQEWTQELINIIAVVSRPSGYQVIEKPDAATDRPMFELGGPFESQTAAELFKLKIIEETQNGNAPEALCSLGYLTAFNHAAREIDRRQPIQPAEGLLRAGDFPANSRCAPSAKK